MSEKITIELALHPLAWKVLKRDYHYDGRAVDVGRGWLYYIILQGLERQQVLTPMRDKSRMPKNLVKGKVYILYEDSLRFGRYMRLPRQANISRMLYRQKKEQLCQQVALFHVATENEYEKGIERNKLMRHFLETEGIEEDELSFEALKKHYQRHYRQKEEIIRHEIKQLND